MTPELDAVVREGVVVVVAGSDTTSTTLCAMLYLLMRHPNVYRKLQEEIDKYYPSGENALDCKHHTQMQYLDAVM